ncbi:sulfur transferase domain-containing protein [Psychrobacter sp. HD31]|uniref:beta-lactamase hydrolase domain-containing protein n=1 Tax=Psychrobacter sp. HD31 TaxID=3112003 RepID=UPI003DA29D2C
MKKHQITNAPQIGNEQVAQIAQKGYKTIICFCKNDECKHQPTHAEIEKSCHQVGIAFKAIPFAASELSHAQVTEFAEYFNQVEHPVYMYCQTGVRAKLIYQAALVSGLLD